MNWELLDEVFDRAVNLPAAERAAYLAQACGGDAELRREAESLLAHTQNTETSALDGIVAQAAMDLPAATEAGTRVGNYELVREVGRGGMGVVYEAVRRDDQFRQSVAIKLVTGGLESEELLRRFRSERQMLSDLNHPNIARIFDGGATADGRPYFVMEFVEGRPLIEYCRENKLPLAKRLSLFRSICAAVQHAHQRMIVHRDLKPGNVLVTAEGVPKLLDFGIAKALDAAQAEDAATLTITGMRMMTPDYASPEQVRGEPVTAATDVYSLGAVLYEMLTGERAHRFKDRSALEIARAVCETETIRPSLAAPTLRKQLSGDLDNIVLMAMRKEPERRYHSVEQLSEDIRRYLDGLPVLAARDTFGYRSGKFLRRHKFGIAAVAVLILSLSAGLATTLYQMRRAERRFLDGCSFR